MFTLELEPSPTTNAPLPFITVGEATNTLEIAEFTPFTDSPLESFNSIPLQPSQPGEPITLTLPETISAVPFIQVDQIPYTLALSPSNPQPGEYLYDPHTNQLTIYPVTLSPTPQLQYLGLSDRYPTIPIDVVPAPHPDFFAQWNIEGVMSESRGLKGHPSASMSFTTRASNEGEVRSQLANGTFVTLYGIGYFVSSLDVVRLSKRKHPAGLIGVRVQFEGKWASRGSTVRSPLDKAISLRKLDPNGKQGKSSLAELAAKSSVPFSGASIKIEVPRNTPSTATVTFRQELESRAITVFGFPYYSNSNRVEIRRYGGTAIHFLSDADVLSEEIPYNLPGHGAYWDGVRIVEELNNAVLNLPQNEATEDERVTLCEGNPNPEIPPRYEEAEEGKIRAERISLRNKMMFDAGGPTKTKTCTTYRNSQPIYAHTVKYGFVYCFADVYTVSSNGEVTVATFDKTVDWNLKKFWFKIEDSQTTWLHSKTGDLIQIERRGDQQQRFKIDTEAMESVELKKQLFEMAQSQTDATEKASLENQLKLYQFSGKIYTETVDPASNQSTQGRSVTLPIKGTTTFGLKKLSDHYDDIEDSTDSPSPTFVVQELRLDSSYQQTPDPTATEDEPKPPLVTGKRFQEETTREIISTTKGKELYTEIHSTANQEGLFLGRALRISTHKDVKGRPPTQTRLQKNQREHRTPKSARDDYKYILNTHDSPVGADDPEQGSVGYPDISDPSKALAIASLDYSMKNMASETLSLKTRYKREYNEGDLLAYSGHLYVIQSIQINRKIDRLRGHPRVVCESFDLKLGRYMQIPVTMRRVNKKKRTGTSVPLSPRPNT